jgi:NADP-dependent 3-hydroxy acid dehydrogenase YdfG
MPAETRDLTDTVVAITGGTSGIGAAAARLLVEAGARVVVGARREERLEALARELGDERCAVVPMDTTVPADAERLVATAIERFGRLDSIVVNAGIGKYGGILDGSDAEMAEIIDVNLTGSVWPIRAAVRHMRPAGGGDIVIVSSVAGLRGGDDEAVYAATKFGQVGLAGSIERELRTDGIRVTTIAPAGVKTEFAIGHGRTEGDPALDDYLLPEDVAAAITTVLAQPRRIRTTLWAMWSMGQGS